MKYLILLAVLAVAYGIWRSQREATVRRSSTPSSTLPRVQNMVACAHCGLHTPTTDAVEHQGRHYCSLAHRQQGPA